MSKGTIAEIWIWICNYKNVSCQKGTIAEMKLVWIWICNYKNVPCQKGKTAEMKLVWIWICNYKNVPCQKGTKVRDETCKDLDM